MKVVALAGGVGGAKLAQGLQACLDPDDLCIIVNTGDDFWHWGLKVCPDLDTVCYTLAGHENPMTGWGRANETFTVLENISLLGGEDWFRIGDRDLATHLERTMLIKSGIALSQIVAIFLDRWGIKVNILPMTDDEVSTIVILQGGVELSFQDYFVRYKCVPVVKGFRFNGIENARPAPGILDKIKESDLVVICPSNPWVSIRPILEVPGIYPSLLNRKVIGVSPLIGGKTVKGPAAKMFSELGIKPSSKSIAEFYKGLVKGLIIDQCDSGDVKDFSGCGIIPFVTETLMVANSDRSRLASEVINFSKSL